MAWNDEADRHEQQRRVDAAISRASACHMSNAKWRKLFSTLRQLGVGRLAWKFVGSEQISHQEPPPDWALMESCLGDFGIAPAVPYREIDWVEVPAERAAGVAEGLAQLGQFPMVVLPSGIRITGYSW